MPRKKNKRKAVQNFKRRVEARSIRFLKPPPLKPNPEKIQSDMEMAIALAFASPKL